MKNTMNNSIKLVAGFASMALALSIAAADVTVDSGGTATLTKKLSHAPAVPGDLNHDGYFDGIDIDQFWNAYDSGGPGADVNGDGFTDGIDYDLFVKLLDAAYASASPADVNFDGFVDGIDMDIFWYAFETGSMAADLNRDGFVDGSDADLFMNALEASR